MAAVLDVGTQGRQALPTIARLHAARHALPILVLSDAPSRTFPIDVLRSGGDACIDLSHHGQCVERAARLRRLHRRGVLATAACPGGAGKGFVTAGSCRR